MHCSLNRDLRVFYSPFPNCGPFIIDVCNTYSILDDPKRKSTYSGTFADPRCDSSSLIDSTSLAGDWKAKNWYRFEEPAGTMIATASVTKSHCGTHATGWLNGDHPITLGKAL